MRTSSAEQSMNQGSEVGRRWKFGYRLRPTEDSRRAPMTSRRSQGRGWELRLGALQVSVWLGLAIGSVFGSYFLGYLSGRSVGFDSARAASGVEVPKLAITEELPEKNSQNMAGIIDKLSAPAIVTQDEKKPQGTSKQAPIGDQRIAKTVQEIKEERAQIAEETTDSGTALKGAASESDAIFNQDVALADSLIANGGLDGNTISGKGGEARVLGQEVPDTVTGEKISDGAKTGTSSDGATTKVVKSPESDEAKASVVKAKAAAEEKTAVKEAPKKPQSFVVKSVPTGYYAQVAAPKTLDEAEAIARKLKKSGFPVVVESSSLNKAPFYRVLVGPEDNKVQGERLVGQLKSERYINGTPFIRKVK
jgi:cell division septation protein DedD